MCIIFCSICEKFVSTILHIWRLLDEYNKNNMCTYDENNIVRVPAYLHIYSSGRVMTMTATTISTKASNRPC